MNFLTIFRFRSLRGLLCLVFSVLTFISLQLNEINDHALNPFMVIIIAAVSLALFVNRQQGIFLLSICFAALFYGVWSVLSLIHSLNADTIIGLNVLNLKIGRAHV